jgi:hypothetical protein
LRNIWTERELQLRSNTLSEEAGNLDALEGIIRCGRELLALRPPGHPDRAMTLLNLAVHLHTRFKQTGRKEDLNDAIKLDREALELLLPGHPDRPLILTHLASFIARRAKEPKDFTDAIDYLAEAQSLLPPLHPHHSSCQYQVACVCLRYHDHHPVQSTLVSDAFTAYASAASHTTSNLADRLSCACAWAQEARTRGHDSSICAYSVCLDLLNRISVQIPTLE